MIRRTMKIQRIRTSPKKTSQAQQDEKKRTMLKIMKTMTATVLIVKTKGYALQFGLFSTEAKAEELVSKLEG